MKTICEMHDVCKNDFCTHAKPHDDTLTGLIEKGRLCWVVNMRVSCIPVTLKENNKSNE